MRRELEHLIQSKQANSLVLYRMPYGKDYKLIVGNSEELTFGVDEHVAGCNGFVFEPFDNEQVKGVFISEVYGDENIQLTDDVRVLLSPLFLTQEMNTDVDCNYEAYKAQFELMHNAIADESVDKVILSRTMIGPHIEGCRVIEFFENLANKYPHAFVYAINTPESGMWIGAGPELLLKNDRVKMSTVSLAGTLPNDSKHTWGNKELDEQQLVTEYVEDVLLKHRVAGIQEVGPETIPAGQVKHLCTTFNFKSEEVNGNHLGLLYDLHPTPAVCGMPKEKAHQLIVETEGHERAFYSGFLGPVKERRYEFYVNIRCLKVYDNSSVLYVGGGLTKDSEVKKEWEETELKALTLLSVLRNI